MPKHPFPLRASLLSLALLGGVLVVGPAQAMTRDDPPATAAKDPDYEAGKKAVDAKDWKAAIASLNKAAARDAKNADIQNYLGYAYRNSGDMESALKHYAAALAINPKHRGAREYLGEAYLLMNDVQKAEAELAQLDQLCTFGCVEYTELKTKIAAFKGKSKTS